MQEPARFEEGSIYTQQDGTNFFVVERGQHEWGVRYIKVLLTDGTRRQMDIRCAQGLGGINADGSPLGNDEVVGGGRWDPWGNYTNARKNFVVNVKKLVRGEWAWA